MFKWTNIISSKIKRHRPIGDKRRKPNNVIPEGVTTKQSQWRIVEAEKGEKIQKSAILGSYTKAKNKHEWAWSLSEYENSLQYAQFCEIICQKFGKKVKKSLVQLALNPFLHSTAETPKPGFRRNQAITKCLLPQWKPRKWLQDKLAKVGIPKSSSDQSFLISKQLLKHFTKFLVFRTTRNGGSFLKSPTLKRSWLKSHYQLNSITEAPEEENDSN